MNGGAKSWILTGLVAVALTPLAINEWRELCKRSATQDEMNAWIATSQASKEAKRPLEAVMAARAALSLDPLSSVALAALVDAESTLLLDAPQRTPAADAPQIAARLRRTQENATGKELARLQVALGNVDLISGLGDPISLYRLATAADPEFGAAQFYLGNALILGGKHAEAEESLKKARLLIPRDPRPAAALGVVYEKLKKWALANETLTAAAELEPNAETFARLGRVRVEQEKWPEAVDALQRALKGLPAAQQGTVLGHLGFALFRQDKYDEAIDALQRSSALVPSINTLFRLAVVRQAAAQFGLAASIFANVVEQDPNAGEAHARLVESLVAAGRPDAARTAGKRFQRLAAGNDALTRYAGVVERVLAKLETK